MREVGVDSPFAAPDVGYSEGYLHTHADCEKRLLDIEHDLGNSVCTFEAVQWAISELHRMDVQERNSIPGNELDEDGMDGAAWTKSPLAEQKGNGGVQIPEKVPSISQPAVSDLATKGPAVARRSDITSEPESLDEKPIKRRPHQVEEPAKAGVRNWRQIFKANSVGKRKADEEASGSESEKRAKMGESLFLTTSKALIEADHGEAGKGMAERITARLALPECIFLTNLISHCLLVSMDQVPTKSIQDAIASLCLNRTGAADSSNENDCSTTTTSADGDASTSGEWLWLHKWLVRTVLSDAGDDSPFASLDWLIAFMTATRQSLIKPILEDLASDLLKREMEGSSTLASYMRRTGVLEYAAFRWE